VTVCISWNFIVREVEFNGFSEAVLEGSLGDLENKYPTIPTIEVAIPHFNFPPRNSTYREKPNIPLQIKTLRCSNLRQGSWQNAV